MAAKDSTPLEEFRRVTATIEATSCRPRSLSLPGTRASTMATSSACGK